MNQLNVPRHIAIILDGNRRWARDRGLPTVEGHRRGFERVIELGKKARSLGIQIFTVWAFSTENWDRSAEEKKYLMKLYEIAIDKNLKEALKEQIRIIHIGRKDRIPKKLKNKITDAEEKTVQFTKYYFVIALDYGGRDDVIRAIQKISNLPAGRQVSNLNENKFNQFLDTKDLPQSDVDLIIRTGGEVRTSGFLLWQAEYAEYIFIKKYLPDFTPQDLKDCIKEYSQRQRRFGR